MRLTLILFVLSFFGMGIIGCSGGGQQPSTEKATLDKLNSDDANERADGVDEAVKKYGGGS